MVYCAVSSCVQLFTTPWIVAHQASLSIEFSRQEYWSGLPFPSPGDLPNPGIEHGSPSLQAGTLLSEPPGKLPTLGSSRVFLCKNPGASDKLLSQLPNPDLRRPQQKSQRHGILPALQLPPLLPRCAATLILSCV